MTEEQKQIQQLKTTLNALVRKAAETRQAQNNYFRTKNNVDLGKSKALEADLDEYLQLLKKRGYGTPAQDASVGKLF